MNRKHTAMITKDLKKKKKKVIEKLPIKLKVFITTKLWPCWYYYMDAPPNKTAGDGKYTRILHAV